MATLSTLPCCISRPSSNFTTTTTCSSPLSIAPRNAVTAGKLSHQSTRLCIPNSRWNCKASRLQRLSKLRSSVAQEQETLIPQEEEEEGLQQQQQQPVSVSVSPSDILTMFFQAEGTMNEAAIPTVAKALEETEGISNLKVQVLEGIATVELTKQTTVQATGVASSLVEIIQGSGFKLQTLNLSFEDEEDIE